MEQEKEVLLLSGIHGDEYGVIISVKKYLRNSGTKLPLYTYIPEVSPSAVSEKRRNNKNNIDLNRSFFNGSKDEEIIALKNKLEGRIFSSVFTFHEDCDRQNEFYLYTSQNINPKIMTELKKELKKIKIELFNGIDDPADPVLNNAIKDGTFISAINNEKKGTLWPWLSKNNKVRYCIDFEIPLKATQQKKDKIVTILFNCFISQHARLFLV